MREVWTEAKWFPDYLVSNHGNVIDECDIPVETRVREGGLLEVDLRNDRGRFKVLVHRLVVSTFFDIEVEGLEVVHIDGNTRNNAVWNLEVLTREENRRRLEELRRLRKPVRIVNLDTGDEYSSLNEAGRRLGYSSALTLPRQVRENGGEFKSRGYRLKLV